MPANTYGRQVVEALTNKSGGGVIAGDVVVVDTTNNDAFTTSTAGAFTGLIGIAQETIANNATGRVLTAGYAALVNVSASVTRGNFGKTHTVAKQAVDAGASRVAGAFCQFLTGGTTPDAHLFGLADNTSGAGTGTLTTVKDEGSNLSTAVASIDFVGAGVTATGTTAATVTVPGGLLAVNKYAPGSTIIFTVANSATLADVDAANMAVTFVAPASGNVLVRLGAVSSATVSGDDMVWGLRESSTIIARGRGYPRSGSATEVFTTAAFYVTGISAGSHTYKWAFSNAVAGGGTQRMLVQDGASAGAWPPAIMEVWAAP